jgi:hypothetical protein
MTARITLASKTFFITGVISVFISPSLLVDLWKRKLQTTRAKEPA